MRRRYLVVILACVVAITLVACAPADSTSGSEGTSTGALTKTPASNISTKSGEGVLPQAEKVKVPDEVGFGMTTARMNLGESHLTFEVRTEPPGADLPMDNTVIVVAQDPPAGTEVDSGSTVVLTIKKK